MRKPKYVKIQGCGNVLTLQGEGYWMSRGEWGIECKWQDGKLVAVAPKDSRINPDTDGMELIAVKPEKDEL